MCVVSMVHDHYAPLIPDWTKPFAPTPILPIQPEITPAQATDWARIAEEFRRAVAAARVVDELTKQPDCVDPEKAKLEERVAMLEKRLAELEAAQKPKKSKKLAVRKTSLKVSSRIRAGETETSGMRPPWTPVTTLRDIDPEFP